MAQILKDRRSRQPGAAEAMEFGPVTQQGIDASTPMGATLVAGGATFRVWAPAALELHVHVAHRSGVIDAANQQFSPSEATKLKQYPDGRWAGFVPGVREGDHYRFYVTGREQPYARDPQARELEFEGWPDVDCIVRSPASYPWHDQQFPKLEFSDTIIYQFHFGTWYAVDKHGKDDRAKRIATFLDAVDRIPYLEKLGVTAIQPLPVTEFNSVPFPEDPSPRSLGYNGTDLFSPEMDYGVEAEQLQRYLQKVNELLAAKGKSPLQLKDLEPQVNQLKAFVDLCHVYGIAVLFDVVYNHAGGFDRDPQNLFHYLNERGDHLYFKEDGWAGGLVFNFASPDVRQFLIDNARYCMDEYHVDGFRYDEVSVIDRFGGWNFCQDLTRTVKAHRPSSLHIAEFWTNDQSWAVRRTEENGAGFDATVYAGLRGTVPKALEQASFGRESPVDMQAIRGALYRPGGFAASWQAVQHLENHDKQRVQNDNDREPRLPRRADGSNARSWYARSRSRVASGILLTAPGIPMLFMGQEFLEDKFWTDDPDNHPGHLIWWDGLQSDRHMQDHLTYMRDLVRLRRRHPALRGEDTNPYYAHDVNRILAFHRWRGDQGRDVVVVASLNDSTFYGYELGFPQAGRWLEVFNSDYYDHFPNPAIAGNGGGIDAFGPPRDDLPVSAALTIPANGLLVFARDNGDR